MFFFELNMEIIKCSFGRHLVKRSHRNVTLIGSCLWFYDTPHPTVRWMHYVWGKSFLLLSSECAHLSLYQKFYFKCIDQSDCVHVFFSFNLTQLAFLPLGAFIKMVQLNIYLQKWTVIVMLFYLMIRRVKWDNISLNINIKGFF